ncbi:MAG: hypothetical protein OEW86_08465 [Nitrosopumilus sp.]|nr:hypothetical protein [Nitrosopumilus sp.]MDH5417999.1 hypothetical protein [Nitrosopumilus sp.]MDH5555588.1 hypothetical protein [Nitrosopumilus sp.]
MFIEYLNILRVPTIPNATAKIKNTKEVTIHTGVSLINAKYNLALQ